MKHHPEKEPKAPTDLQKALAQDTNEKERWNDLTPLARRDFILWIDTAKEPDARKHLIQKTCELLTIGKRQS